MAIKHNENEGDLYGVNKVIDRHIQFMKDHYLKYDKCNYPFLQLMSFNSSDFCYISLNSHLNDEDILTFYYSFIDGKISKVE